MIYDAPDPSSPISQGDIFFFVPKVHLPEDELTIIDDDGARALDWEDFASDDRAVSAVLDVRPTVGIVGTQECDALRAPEITLFEGRPFRDVEGKSNSANSPKSWVNILTQHARVNQKWFYLPPDARVGFSEKMGADFLTPIRVPRAVLERLMRHRRGRLNHVAGQHFRERVSEFFRRYPYDEWYALDAGELAEYGKQHKGVEPFPWQPGHQPGPGVAQGCAAPGGAAYDESSGLAAAAGGVQARGGSLAALAASFGAGALLSWLLKRGRRRRR